MSGRRFLRVGLRFLLWPLRQLLEMAEAWWWVWKTSDCCDRCYVNTAGQTITKAFFYCVACHTMFCLEHGAKVMQFQDAACCRDRKFARMQERATTPTS